MPSDRGLSEEKITELYNELSKDAERGLLKSLREKKE
jgi:hypothetical protein